VKNCAKLVEQIPEADVRSATRLLRSLIDPVERTLLFAPFDDEPETQEERDAVEASRNDPSGDVPFEQLRRPRR
jgi:hypothetical protein